MPRVPGRGRSRRGARRRPRASRQRRFDVKREEKETSLLKIARDGREETLEEKKNPRARDSYVVVCGRPPGLPQTVVFRAFRRSSPSSSTTRAFRRRRFVSGELRASCEFRFGERSALASPRRARHDLASVRTFLWGAFSQVVAGARGGVLFGRNPRVGLGRGPLETPRLFHTFARLVVVVVR